MFSVMEFLMSILYFTFTIISTYFYDFGNHFFFAFDCNFI